MARRRKDEWWAILRNNNKEREGEDLRVMQLAGVRVIGSSHGRGHYRRARPMDSIRKGGKGLAVSVEQYREGQGVYIHHKRRTIVFPPMFKGEPVARTWKATGVSGKRGEGRPEVWKKMQRGRKKGRVVSLSFKKRSSEVKETLGAGIPAIQVSKKKKGIADAGKRGTRASVRPALPSKVKNPPAQISGEEGTHRVGRFVL